MNVKRFVRKNAISILVVLVLAFIVYNYTYSEGFQGFVLPPGAPPMVKSPVPSTCIQSRCRGNGREWINNKCYERCSAFNSTYIVNPNDRTKCMTKLRPGETQPSTSIRRTIINNC